MASLGTVRTYKRSLVIGIPANVLSGRSVTWLSSDQTVQITVAADGRSAIVTKLNGGTTITFRDTAIPTTSFDLTVELGGG
jgi:hypothetical protein